MNHAENHPAGHESRPESTLPAERGETARGEVAARDEWEAWADRLAYAITPVEVIGEHSSANDPHANALDEAAKLHARVEKAEAEVERVWRWFETDAAALRERAEAAEAERDAIRQALARVELLAEWFESQPNWQSWGIHEQIRAHAKVDTPAAPAVSGGRTSDPGPEGANPDEEGASGEADLIARLKALAEEWWNAAEHGEDERYGRIIGRTLRGCADELHEALGGCCTACKGEGYGYGGEPCWDCRATGHPHPRSGEPASPVVAEESQGSPKLARMSPGSPSASGEGGA